MPRSTPNSQSPVRARLFKNGRSQAVRLPKEFRFEGDEVQVSREGDRVILEPIRKRPWPPGYWRWLENHREDLDLGRLDQLNPALADIDLDDD